MGEILDPLTGEILDSEDVDSLALAAARWQRMGEDLRLAREQVAHILASRIKDVRPDCRTYRVSGDSVVAKVTLPKPSWNQGELKALWSEFPEYRDKFLAIERFRPQAREVAKLANWSAEGRMEQFKERLFAARQPSFGTPKIEIEEAV